MLWDGITPPETLAASLPPAYSLLESSSNESKGVKFLRVYLDQLAISKYYMDAIRYGDEVFLQTHNGDVHAGDEQQLDKGAGCADEGDASSGGRPEVRKGRRVVRSDEIIPGWAAVKSGVRD